MKEQDQDEPNIRNPRDRMVFLCLTLWLVASTAIILNWISQ